MSAADWAVPLLLSLQVAAAATALALAAGVPLAWALARDRLPWPALWSTAAALPLALPPTVVGYGLLALLGRTGPLGRLLEAWGLPVVFTWRGAVVAAAVAALPLVVETVRPAFEGIEPELRDAGRTLGHGDWSLFWRVELPLAGRAVAAAALLGFARAVGEFGATLMVAGNIPGRTQTLALAVYDAVQAGDARRAAVYVLASTGLALAAVVGVRRLSRPRPGGR